MQHSKKAFVIAFFIILFAFLILFQGDAVTKSVKDALSLCTSSLIPSLFPYLVLSELVVSSGAAEQLGSFFCKPFKTLFGISGDGASAFLLGALCGFPIGARSAVLLYKNQKISKKEAEHLLCFCNNTGAGFLIAGVGASFFGSRHLGVLLYITQLLSALIIGLLTRPIFKDQSNIMHKSEKANKITAVKLFTESIGSATQGMLSVCGYVIFFSGLIGGLCSLFKAFASPLFCTVISGFLEISSGARSCAAISGVIGSNIVICTLCAAFVGWSGVSVHAQTASICNDSGLSLTPYIISKLLHGVLCAALVLGYMLLWSGSAEVVASPDEYRLFDLPVWFSFILNFTFIFTVLRKLIKKCGKKTFFVIQ